MNHLRHEQRGPEVAFSVEALLQLQWRALCWPQEHLAWAAQTQEPSWPVLQQVITGWTILMIDDVDFETESWKLMKVRDLRLYKVASLEMWNELVKLASNQDEICEKEI